jgi:uncharacterized membrane protein YeaQ/YmgE (transglycosylase-associated protein family)
VLGIVGAFAGGFLFSLFGAGGVTGHRGPDRVVGLARAGDETIVGAIAGFFARWISPSPNNPQGFVLTTVLGIVGSVVATLLGRAVHLYGPDQSAGIIASIR